MNIFKKKEKEPIDANDFVKRLSEDDLEQLVVALNEHLQEAEDDEQESQEQENEESVRQSRDDIKANDGEEVDPRDARISKLEAQIERLTKSKTSSGAPSQNNTLNEQMIETMDDKKLAESVDELIAYGNRVYAKELEELVGGK